VRFIKIFALVIENFVVHIYFKSGIPRKQKLAIMEKLYLIDYYVNISFYVK